MKNVPLQCKTIFFRRSYVLALLIIPVAASIGQVNAGWKYKQELYSFLQQPSDTNYIQDRGTLEEISESVCTKTEIRYHTTTTKGELLQIAIKSKPFIASHHSIKFTDTLFSTFKGKKRIEKVVPLNHIDSTLAIGVNCTIPATEFASFIILVNNKKITIPSSAYKDLYNIHFCANNKKPELYVTRDSKYIYIYMHGSDGKDSYSVKFIFNTKMYLTRIVNTHPCLADFDFIDGFGECE